MASRVFTSNGKIIHDIFVDDNDTIYFAVSSGGRYPTGHIETVDAYGKHSRISCKYLDSNVKYFIEII